MVVKKNRFRGFPIGLTLIDSWLTHGSGSNWTSISSTRMLKALKKINEIWLLLMRCDIICYRMKLSSNICYSKDQHCKTFLCKFCMCHRFEKCHHAHNYPLETCKQIPDWRIPTTIYTRGHRLTRRAFCYMPYKYSMKLLWSAA